MKSCPTWLKEVSIFDWEYDLAEPATSMEGEVKVTTPEGEAVECGPGDLVTFARAEVQLGRPQAGSASTIAPLRVIGTALPGRPEAADMAALETPAGELGWQAEDFTLKDAYGNPIRLYDLKGPTGTLVMFICNHCP